MILLDTCAIIWDAVDSSKLTSRAKKLIKQNEGQLLICDISIWEISMLIKKERLVIDDTASGFINLLLQSRNYLVQETDTHREWGDVSAGWDAVGERL